MAGRVIKRLLAGVLTVAVVIPGNFVPAQAAEEPQEDYLIYPNPHKVEYQEGDYILGKELNVIYDKGIDEATKNRLQEAADLKGIEVNEAEQPKEGATNVYVGVHGQDGTAEDYITEEYQPEDSLFGKTDSYFLAFAASIKIKSYGPSNVFSTSIASPSSKVIFFSFPARTKFCLAIGILFS